MTDLLSREELSRLLMDDIRSVQEIAGLTISEMARWYDVGYSTMYGWLRRGIFPAAFKTTQLAEGASDLEDAAHRGLLPIPLSVKQGKRAFYLKELKDGYNSGVPSARLTRDGILSRMEQK